MLAFVWHSRHTYFGRYWVAFSEAQPIGAIWVGLAAPCVHSWSWRARPLGRRRCLVPGACPTFIEVEPIVTLAINAIQISSARNFFFRQCSSGVARRRSRPLSSTPSLAQSPFGTNRGLPRWRTSGYRD